MVRIAGFHPADPGSSPGVGIVLLGTLPPWRNWIARKTSNLEVAGSNPVGGIFFILWFCGEVVITRDFESLILGSNPSKTLWFP